MSRDGILDEGFVPWPRETAERYRAAGYWTGDRLDAVAQHRLPEHADALAVVDDASSLTYGDLETRVRLTATALTEAGIRPRDRALLQLGNRAEFVVTALALMRIAAIPVYALPSHGERELSDIADTAGAAAVLTAGDGAALARAEAVRAAVPSVRAVLRATELARGGASAEAPPDPRVDVDTGDVAFLQLSGGTTGSPKLIPRTHDDYLYSVRRSAEVCGLTPDDSMLILLPVAHNFPMSSPGFLGVLGTGGTVVLSGPRSPRAVFDRVAATAATIAPLVPPLALTLVNAAERAGEAVREQLASLRLVQVGGAKLAPELAARIRPALGANVQQVFGMAEGLVCYTDPDDRTDRPLLVQGKPMSEADELRVVGPDGRPVPEGTPGDLEVRGPYTIRGYWHAPEANAASFTADGYYRTGDVVARDAEGHLTVHGRSKDHINRGGEKISAEEVENLLLGHPGVHDAIVVGVPDAFLGEKAVGVVVPNDPGLTGDDLADHMRRLKVEALKIPDRFVFRQDYPTTGVGKISRAELRRRLRAELGG